MRSDVIDLLKDLVAIDSVNPSLVPGGAGESEIAGYVTGWADAAGLDIQVLEATAGRPSVVVRGGDHRGGKTLMLCGHLDTVGVGGMSDPLSPRIDGDRIYGRGTYDMKGGLAAALVACRDAARAGIAGEVVVAAVADEEHASIGVQEALRHVSADAAVVTEPTELEIVIAHKGFVWTELTVEGRAAHGSRPHLGVDAIVKAGPLLSGIGALDERLGEHEHPLVGRSSVHASMIEGGLDLATYPDRCTVKLERRTVPGEDAQGVDREIAELLERCRREDPALAVEARTLLVRPPFEVGADASLVGALSDTAAARLGSPPPVVGASYWADSAFIAAAGIPTVLFGPTGEGAHAAEEWVSASATAACTDVLVELAASVCG